MPAVDPSNQEVLLTWFTGGLVIVGLIQAAILALTIRVLNRQTASNQNVERAWLMAEIDWDREKWSDGEGHIVEGTGTDGKHTAIWIVLTCHNEGKSPGWIYEKRLKFEVVKEIIPTPDFDSAQFVWAGREPIGIGQAFPNTTKVPQLAVAEGHARDDYKMIVYGVVKYRDIFNRDRSTTVGYEITRDRKMESLSQAAYNQST